MSPARVTLCLFLYLTAIHLHVVKCNMFNARVMSKVSYKLVIIYQDSALHWNICYYLIVTVIEILVLFMETPPVKAKRGVNPIT